MNKTPHPFSMIAIDTRFPTVPGTIHKVLAVISFKCPSSS